MIDASFLYRAVIAAVRAKNFDGAVDVAHSMSLLWKYVMIQIDSTLYRHQEKHKRLTEKFEGEVHKTVKEKIRRFETDRMSMEAKLEKLLAQIESLEKLIEGKNMQIKKLHEAVVQQELRFESLRDPTGLQQFKRLINSFTAGIDSIYAEKDTQYSTMKQVVRIMEDMEKKNEEQEGEEAAKKKQQEEIIKDLMRQKEDLKSNLKKTKQTAKDRINELEEA